jgi:hypothetical protein
MPPARSGATRESPVPAARRHFRRIPDRIAYEVLPPFPVATTILEDPARLIGGGR